MYTEYPFRLGPEKGYVVQELQDPESAVLYNSA